VNELSFASAEPEPAQSTRRAISSVASSVVSIWNRRADVRFF